MQINVAKTDDRSRGNRRHSLKNQGFYMTNPIRYRYFARGAETLTTAWTQTNLKHLGLYLKNKLRIVFLTRFSKRNS